jgi:hypothetical protein
MRASTSVKYASGSMSFNLQVSIRDAPVGPMFGGSVRAREQRVLPAERDRADGALDGVVVELDAAVIDEARQALPARQGITDGLGKIAFLADQAEFCAVKVFASAPRPTRTVTPSISTSIIPAPSSTECRGILR